MIVHYGTGKGRAACGIFTAGVATTVRDDVTCTRCRRTVKFIRRWFAAS